MFFHVMVGANDLEASRKFYDSIFTALGVPAKGKFRDDPAAYMYGDPASGLFFVTNTQDGAAASPANGGTIMFKANSVDAAAAWYAAGLANGGKGEDTLSPGGIPDTMMARLRDPTGNKIAVVAFA